MPDGMSIGHAIGISDPNRSRLDLSVTLARVSPLAASAQGAGAPDAPLTEKIQAIGGWQVFPAESGQGYSGVQLPLAALHPEPARLAIPEDAAVTLCPALCFRIGRSLALSGESYLLAEIAAAMESSHPGVLLTLCRTGEPDPGDPSGMVPGACFPTLVYGKGVPGLKQPEMLALRVIRWVGWKETRNLPTVVVDGIGDALLWLANLGSASQGGIRAGQMVAFPLLFGETRIQPGWIKLVMEEFGKVEFQILAPGATAKASTVPSLISAAAEAIPWMRKPSCRGLLRRH